MPLNAATISALSKIKNQFGDANFNDFLRVVNASPEFQNQLNSFVARTGTIDVGVTTTGGNGEYTADPHSPSNTAGGSILITSSASLLLASSDWSIGYGIAQVLAHELGHAFDPQLGSTAQNAAATQDQSNNDTNKTKQVILGVRSEAVAEINSWTLLSQARVNLIGNSNAAQGGGILFDPSSQITGFRSAEAVIRAFSNTSISNDLAVTCSANEACIAQLTQIMGRETSAQGIGFGYFNLVYRKLTHGNGTFNANEAFLSEAGNYVLVEDSTNPNQINVLDKQTSAVIQTITAQAFDDGSSLMTEEHLLQNGSVNTEVTVSTSALDDNGNTSINTTTINFHPGLPNGERSFDSVTTSSDNPTSKINEVKGVEDANGNIISASVSGTGAVVDLSGAGDNTYLYIEDDAQATVIEGNGTHNEIEFYDGGNSLYIKSGSANLLYTGGLDVTVGGNANVRDFGENNAFTVESGGVITFDYDSGDSAHAEGVAQIIRAVVGSSPSDPSPPEEITYTDASGNVAEINSYDNGRLEFVATYENGTQTKFISYQISPGSISDTPISETDFYPTETITTSDGVVTSIQTSDSWIRYDPLTGEKTFETDYDDNGIPTDYKEYEDGQLSYWLRSTADGQVSDTYDSDTGHLESEFRYVGSVVRQREIFDPETAELIEQDNYAANGGITDRFFSDGPDSVYQLYDENGNGYEENRIDTSSGQLLETKSFSGGTYARNIVRYSNGAKVESDTLDQNTGATLERDEYDASGTLTRTSKGDGGDYFTEISEYSSGFLTQVANYDSATGKLTKDTVYNSTTHRISAIYYFNGGSFPYQIDFFTPFGLLQSRNTYNPATGQYLYGTGDGTANQHSQFPLDPLAPFNNGIPRDPSDNSSIFTVRVIGFGTEPAETPPPLPSAFRASFGQPDQLIAAMASFGVPPSVDAGSLATGTTPRLSPPLVAAAH